MTRLRDYLSPWLLMWRQLGQARAEVRRLTDELERTEAERDHARDSLCRHLEEMWHAEGDQT